MHVHQVTRGARSKWFWYVMGIGAVALAVIIGGMLLMERLTASNAVYTPLGDGRRNVRVQGQSVALPKEIAVDQAPLYPEARMADIFANIDAAGKLEHYAIISYAKAAHADIVAHYERTLPQPIEENRTDSNTTFCCTWLDKPLFIYVDQTPNDQGEIKVELVLK